MQQWAAVLVGTDQRSHLSVVRAKREKRINKLERYRSGYRYNHDLTATSRYACTVKVEYLSHDTIIIASINTSINTFLRIIITIIINMIIISK